MWNPRKITFNNLFSHHSSEYTFRENECVVIFGKNYDQAGLENNGAGKTTLFEAIAIALTNESLRGVKKETFINRNANWCDVGLELENPVLGKKFAVYRKFFRGSSVKVEIYEDDVLNTQITSVNEANKYIYEVIGINRDDLLKYFIISQDNHYTFFTASDGDKKEVMNRITSADMVNSVIEDLSVQLKEKQAEYNDISLDKVRAVGKCDILEEQRETLLRSDDTVEKLKQAKSELKDIEVEIKDLKQRRNAMDVVDVFQLKQDRKKKKLEIEELDDSVSEIKATKRHLEMELNGKVVCPKCKHEFIPNSSLGLPIKQIKQLIKESEEEINSQSIKREKIENEISKITKEISDGELVNENITTLDFDIKRQEKKKKNTLEEIEELEEKIKNNSELKNIEEKIKIIKDKIKSIESTLSPLNDEIEMIKFWQFYMGRSGFKTYLANKSIKIIEGMTNNFLKKFGVDMRISISGFKVLASGEVREKIDVLITEDGINEEVYMGRSGGERGRIILAGVLAIHKLINLSTNGKGLNLLLLDECFPGMDSLGQENIIKIFEKIGITSMLITQNVSDSFNINNTLQVIKKQGVSSYV